MFAMIRTATVDDLQAASAVVARFSADIGRRFDAEHFADSFAELMAVDLGAMFLLEKDGVIQGVICGLVTPDLFHGGLLASEIAWYVLPEYRGGTGGVRLFLEFERWALEQCAEEIHMVHLQQSMPEELAKFYQRHGYTAMETHYSKVLQRFEEVA